eukprot:9097863-Heterocapsa_arctica.AAC.1
MELEMYEAVQIYKERFDTEETRKTQQGPGHHDLGRRVRGPEYCFNKQVGRERHFPSKQGQGMHKAIQQPK